MKLAVRSRKGCDDERTNLRTKVVSLERYRGSSELNTPSRFTRSLEVMKELMAPAVWGSSMRSSRQS